MPLRHMLIPSVAMLCLFSVAFAQTGGIKGRVTDRELNPIGFATIRVFAADTASSSRVLYETVTDTGGHFAIAHVLPGKYVVKAGSIGYTHLALPVTVSEGQAAFVEFKLKQSGGGMEDVISVVPPQPLPTPIVLTRTPKRCIITGHLLERGTRLPALTAEVIMSFNFTDDDTVEHHGCCWATRSDSTGRYAFSDLYPGGYTLSADDRENYVPDTTQVTVYTKPDSVYTVDFYLTKKAKGK